MNYVQLRNMFERMSKGKPLYSGTEIEHFDINQIPAAWIKKMDSNPKKVIMWIHGGGWMVGSINTHRIPLSYLASYSDSKVLLFDYRLFPENKYPAPLEDALECYCWLLAQGIEPDDIVIGGDSAGAHLSLCLLLKLKQRELPLPGGSILLSGLYNLRDREMDIKISRVNDPVLPKNALDVFRAFFDSIDDKLDPFVSPIWGDFKQLPPMYINAGTAEVLITDTLELASKAEQQGVDVRLEIGEGMIHVYPLLCDFIPEGKEEMKNIANWVKQLK